MPNTSRLAGRFFSVLISLVFAIALPRTAVAGEAVPSPAASPFGVIASLPSGHFLPWSVARRYTLPSLKALPWLNASDGLGPTLCQIIDTVYRADGTPAQGTVVILWPAFTTAAGQPIAPGMVTVQLGPEGQFNASLAPNSGATPAGTYYRATYKLNDGSTSSEYWVVPATQTTTIGAIRSTLVPVTQAAQFLTREYADANYMNLTAGQTAGGVKIFTNSPSVPTPQNPNDAANKAYVDANGGSGNLGAPPPIGNVTPNSVNATLSTAQDLRTANFPVMDLRNYGLKGDGQLQAGCNITSGQSIVTCSSASFTPPTWAKQPSSKARELPVPISIR